MSVIDDLKAIGVDTEAGLKIVAGNEALYTRLLGKLEPLMAKSLGVLTDPAATLDQIAFEAHSLKGSMYNLGVTGMGDLSKTLEHDARAGEEEATRGCLCGFVTQLEAFRNALINTLEA